MNNPTARDIIEEYDSIFKKFECISRFFISIDVHQQLILFASGIALSNSIHEMFIKKIVEDYANINSISNTQKKELIKKYKSPIKLGDLLNQIDVSIWFSNKHADFKSINSNIVDLNSLIAEIELQRTIRNYYSHGDFSFTSILCSAFEKNIVIYQKLHSLLLEIIRSSYYQNNFSTVL